MNESKWTFCPEKKCYFCHGKLTDEDYAKTDKVITRCAKCHRSFLD